MPLRYLTAGESHGKGLVTIVEGLPAGLPLTPDSIDRDLARRQQGYGRGGRMAIESDRVEFLAGVRAGATLGSPLAMLIRNRDWENWQDTMAPEEAHPYAGRPPVTRPRPGHADLSGALKYGHRDFRNVLERASARETAARTVAGSVAKVLLARFGIRVISHVVQIGPCRAQAEPGPLQTLADRAEASPVRCADPEASGEMVRLIREACENGDTLGGVFEVVACGVPPGLGTYAHWDRRLDGLLARALMSINGIKGVEIGAGFHAASLPGSGAHDEIHYDPARGFFRRTNRAGGLEGGVTNGETVVLRAAMKPIATLRRPLASVDLASREPVPAHHERSDVCAVPAAGVVGEAAVAWELAVACAEKFGGDSLAEMERNYRAYLAYLQSY